MPRPCCASKRGDRQAMMTGGSVAITPQLQGMTPFYADARYTSADIFPMFDMPFLFGNGWSSTEDDKHDRVAVIAKALNDKLFGGGNSVGKTVRVDKTDFRDRRRPRRLAADAALLRHEQRSLRRRSNRCSCRSRRRAT